MRLFELGDIWSVAYSILRSHEWMLVIFTGVLALFTAVLAIYTWRLWKDARILQRAYIAVQPRGIHMMLNGSDLLGHVDIVNAGKLPARNLSWFVSINYSPNGNQGDEFFDLEATKANIVVAPGAIATRGSKYAVVAGDVNQACNGSQSGERATEKRNVSLRMGLSWIRRRFWQTTKNEILPPIQLENARDWLAYFSNIFVQH